MKKALALVLGAAMMTSMAYAASIGTSGVIAPGSNIDITIGEFKPGTTAYLTNEYFSISGKKIAKGAALIKEIKIDDTDEVVRIALNDNMSLAEPKNPNMILQSLSIKAKKTVGDVTRGDTLTLNNIEERVGHTVNTVDLSAGSAQLLEGYNKITDSSGNLAYGTVYFSTGDLMMEGRAYKDDKIFLQSSGNANTTVLKNFPDADMRFITVKTSDLPTSFALTVSAEKEEFIYKIVDNKLVSSGLKWSEEDYAWTGRIRTSTQYVISDTKLNVSPADETGTTNPDTGANDIVGIAAALAVVSLVAAGAVSLKK
ncbi:MAG: hypothetical protein RR022_05990 [Angelakisella sp.]